MRRGSGDGQHGTRTGEWKQGPWMGEREEGQGTEERDQGTWGAFAIGAENLLGRFKTNY